MVHIITVRTHIQRERSVGMVYFAVMRYKEHKVDCEFIYVGIIFYIRVIFLYLATNSGSHLEWERKRASTTLWSLIGVWYKFLQGGNKYTAIPSPPFLSPVLLHILALSYAKQMETIDMLMRQGLFHSSPGATSPHTYKCVCVYTVTGYPHAHLMGPAAWSST